MPILPTTPPKNNIALLLIYQHSLLLSMEPIVYPIQPFSSGANNIRFHVEIIIIDLNCKHHAITIYFRIYWGLSVFMFLFSFTALAWRKVEPANTEETNSTPRQLDNGMLVQ